MSGHRSDAERQRAVDDLLDRAAIQAQLVAYTHAIDRRQWDELDAVFTADAVIDYTEMGGIRGDLGEIKAFLTTFMGDEQRLSGFQHMLGLPVIELAGDTAAVRTPCFNPMITGDGIVYFCGLWYRDRFVRQDGRWLIAARHEDHTFKFNRPPRP
jgi:hypothetical protein